MRLLDRLACTVTLRSAGIPMPPTVVTEDVHLAAEAVQRLGPSVLKPLFSTKARGMRLVEPGPGLEDALAEFKEAGNHMLYVQQRVELPGKDLGVAFLGGQYVGTYARVRGNDSWATVVSAGGRYEPYEPSQEIIELARRAQELFGLDFTSVDVGVTDKGPIVFEVSAFGGFHGLKECGLDAAARYADYAIERVDNGA
jgi:ribosomal protein S6--L-glutamate ligase